MNATPHEFLSGSEVIKPALYSKNTNFEKQAT
jgi:hypothetical protein